MIPEETLVGKLHRRFGYPDRRSLLVLAGLVMFVIALGGALYWWGIRDDNDGAPRSNIGTTASPTTKPTATPPAEQPPPMPDAAKQNTMDGVRAFVRHYFDLANYAQRTNDAEPLKAVQQEESCDGCKYQIKLFEDLKKDNQRIIGGEYKFKNVAVTPQGGNYLCVARYSRKDPSIIDFQGRIVESSTGETAEETLLLEVRWMDNQWQIIMQGYDKASVG